LYYIIWEQELDSRQEFLLTHFPLRPNNYFGFQNQPQYSYNVYHQLADNGAGFGARGGRWARVNNVPISFIPPY
jgi:hypothetical protein